MNWEVDTSLTLHNDADRPFAPARRNDWVEMAIFLVRIHHAHFVHANLLSGNLNCP